MNVPKVRRLKGSEMADLGHLATKLLLERTFPFQTQVQLKGYVRAMIYADRSDIADALGQIGRVKTLEVLLSRIGEILPEGKECTINLLGSNRNPLVVIVSEPEERPMALNGVHELSPAITGAGNKQATSVSPLDRANPDALLDLASEFKRILKEGK